VRAVIQINGISNNRPCNVWLKIAEKYGIETIWYDINLDISHINPELLIFQHACHSRPLWNMGIPKDAVIIGSCGDAAAITNTAAAFQNLPMMSALYIEGYDYYDYYDTFSEGANQYAQRLRYFQTCSDNYFEPVVEDKKYDWCFIGQIYPSHEERLKHYRNDIISGLYKALPGYVAGDDKWSDIIGSQCNSRLPQELLNRIYAQSRVVVSVDAHDGNGYTSTRTIEAMYGGHCVCIYDHRGTYGLKQFIQDGIHAFYFDDIEELLGIIDKIKTNPQIAIDMGQAARELVISKGWTYSKWLEGICEEFAV